MERKRYETPTVRTVALRTESMLATSPGNEWVNAGPNFWGGVNNEF